MKSYKNLRQSKSKAHSYRFTVGRLLQTLVALVFFLFTIRFIWLSIAPKVDGENLSQRTKALYQRNTVLKASRGTIFDRHGFTIAEDAHVYTIYAILDKSSINYKNKPEYVVDKQKTADKLSTVLPMSSTEIMKYLTPKHKAFQVQFGAKGSNLSIEQKEKIQAMRLPGIGFVENPSRLYPNGVFASHVIGLAQPETSKKTGVESLIGTMGLEAYFNKQLAGKDGSQNAAVDANQYQNPGVSSTSMPAKNGDDLYLTIDSQLQSYLEKLLDQVQSKYNPVGLTAVVENVRNGKILAASQRPTFDPQTKKGLNDAYRDRLVQDTYEPGSVFKILSLAAAVNSGNYNPNALYKSGSLTIDGSTIHDWNVSGWGAIPFSQAFPRSSNVGMATLEQKMGAKVWRSYIDKFGIGKKTGITLPGEQPGMIAFKTPLDQAVTSFGQGVDVNTMQMMQVYSALANGGQMVKPQLVEKITTPQGKTIQDYKVKKVGQPVVDQNTVKVVLQNMQEVVNAQYGTGAAYKMPDKSIAVKTGTAQIAGPKGGYLTGDSNYIFSVVGLTPANNPKYCVYLTMKQPRRMSAPAETILASIFVPMMNRLIMNDKTTANSSATPVETPPVIGQSTAAAENIAQKSSLQLVKVGSGTVVTNQLPINKQKVMAGSKLFVLTSGDIVCPNFEGWTPNDVRQFALLANITLKVTGSGIEKVTSQNIKPGSVIKQNSVLKVKTGR